MSFVHVLDDNTINKIAAGEVVERPASVVKELVENAIDARADRIEVEIMAGGTSFMRVTDNGIGMSQEDARLAILRHATSKISVVEDLQSIDTLGFRGEALPSIASVSRFSLLTRQAGAELGTAISICGGKEPDISETGCGIGTTIKVEDLFFNTPARKKFLKTNNTEGSKINDFITKLAISNPQIAFKLINNNKTAVVTPGNGNLHDTLRAIYGGTVGDSLIGLDFTDREEEISIKGYISKPSTIRSNRSWQTFIVNGRIVSNRAMSKAIDNAYNALIPKSGYPMVALILEVPQHTIDVNVHPQKSELKFADEGRIFKAVYKAVLDAVRPTGQQLGSIAARVERPEHHAETVGMGMLQRPVQTTLIETMEYIPPSESMPVRRVLESSSAADFVKPVAQEPGVGDIYEETIASRSQDTSLPVKNTSMEENVPVNPGGSKGLDMIPIGQVDRTYIVAQDNKALYIVDQHAAHERILYDRFAAMTDRIPSQPLLVHLLLDFSSRELQLIEENLELFSSLGFGLEPCGPQQFRLTEVPADIPVSEGESIIREILTALEDSHKLSAAEIRHECLAMTACKAAIKAGFQLSQRQMEIILEELGHTAMPYTCPHGRPTILKFSSDELAKMFKRTGF